LPWSAALTAGEDFLSILEGATGANSGMVVVEYTGNLSGLERNGVLTITAPGAQDSPATVTVYQSSETSSAPSVFTADQDASNSINLSELLRVIQFFNLGGFHCAEPPESTEDGYVPGPGANESCVGYASDYNPGGTRTWSIDLTELLRVIQFFNIGGYHYCPAESTEDGFCPGAI
jgi:hypothetical protein